MLTKTTVQLWSITLKIPPLVKCVTYEISIINQHWHFICIAFDNVISIIHCRPNSSFQFVPLAYLRLHRNGKEVHFTVLVGHLEQFLVLTHWGRVTHICVSKLTTTGSDNGLSPGRRQAIIWTNAWILLTGPLGTNSSEILIEIHTFSLKKMPLQWSSGKWRPFCLGLNVLKV